MLSLSFLLRTFVSLNYLVTFTQILFTQIPASCICMGVIYKVHCVGFYCCYEMTEKCIIGYNFTAENLEFTEPLYSLSVWLIFSFGLLGRVSCFCNSSGTLDINGASLKARTLENVDPSRTVCSSNNRGASARHNSQRHFSLQTELNLLTRKDLNSGSYSVVLQTLIQ